MYSSLGNGLGRKVDSGSICLQREHNRPPSFIEKATSSSFLPQLTQLSTFGANPPFYIISFHT